MVRTFMGEEKSSSQLPLNVPAAIVIAGAMIAAAIFFGGRAAPNGVEGTVAGEQAKVAASPTAQPAGVLQESIGDFREVTAADHIRGASGAKVTIIEYSDLECPFCKQFHTTLKQVLDEYPNDVRWVYRHFPIEQLHSKAPAEAKASECAAEQGRFWEFIDVIFEVTPANNGLDLEKLPDFARQAGVPNVPQFEACLKSDKYADKVAADLKDAAAAGARGTPYSVVVSPGGQKAPINGAQPYETVKATIDALL